MTYNQKIEKTFYKHQDDGKTLEESFRETADQFDIEIDDVVDALNEAALERV